MSKGRRTIAVLSDSFLGEYQTLIRSSVETYAKNQDVNLQFIIGRELDSPLFDHRVQNGIFDQVDHQYVDGLLILAGALSNYCDKDRIVQFCQQYTGIPTCCIGASIPEIPSITVKNTAFSQLVEHLILVHGKTSFAFLNGPASNREAQARRAAFMETLRKHQIPFDTDLEAQGDFLIHKGHKAANLLLSLNKPFDALVAANDDMAMGALSAFQQNGVRVPEDIAVTGFDDLCESRFVSPRLTTMRQPFEEAADQAVAILFRQMNGESVPLESELSPFPVIRYSCGCKPPSFIPVTGNVPANRTGIPDKEIQQMQLEAVLLAQVKLSGKTFADWATILVNGLFEELDGVPDAFPDAIAAILDTPTTSAWVIDELHSAITCLRANLQVGTDQMVEVENMWHRARILLFDTLARQHVNDRLALLRTNKILVMRAVDSKPPAGSRTRLLEEIIYELLTVGVQNGIVSIFTTEECTHLECVVAIRNGVQVHSPRHVYAANQLIPDFMQGDSRHSYVIFSLSNGEERLGILALEGGSADSYYEMLAEYLSTNIKLISLNQNHQRQSQFEARERQKALELQHRQKLESLGVLAGGIAHDFNNMLSVMAGNLDVIHMQMTENDPSLEPLQECRSTVSRATGLVQQLLAYSGKGKFFVRRTNVNDIVKELKDFLKMAVSKNVQLRYRLSDKLPDIEADTTQLNQVFVNLVINASDAIEESDRSGIITVETSTQYLDKKYFRKSISAEELPKGDYVTARIIDTGSGIEQKILAQIFDPFYTTKFGGRGLGLAAVLGIIRGHRGAIRVESQKGKGTMFELSFPQLPTGSEQPRAPAEMPRQIGVGTVLIVDDEKAVLKAGSRLLKTIGFSTLEAQNGQQAIDLVQDFPDVINCVLMDITMPGIGGVAAMSEIKKINPRLPVVLTSGYTQDVAVEAKSLIKPEAFLQKPYNLDSLSRIMSEVLNTEIKRPG